jgi:glyoxylase-like metal-dependent hydrolase (beta-lactamase superfamily II)
MRFGGWDAELVEVGRIPMPGSYLAPAGELPERIDVISNVLVLRGPSGVVQVDAGAGPLVSLWEGAREHDGALDGVQPDRIVLTHLDFDHAGGVLAGTWPGEVELAHPQTRVFAPEEAVALSLVPEAEHDSPASHRLITLLQDAGLLDTYADGDEVAPGVRMRGAPGHRSGHSMVELGGEFVFLADTLHHAVHVQHPDWDTMFEDDVELSQRTRRGTIERVCDGPVLGASHIDGFGRITGGAAPAWQAL